MSCHTIIFEPQPSYAQNIANSVALNGFGSYCKVMNVAVSDSKNVSLQSSKEGQTFYDASGGETSAIALDDILIENEKVLLLKIDVEGMEGRVLASAKRLFAEGRIMHVIIEYTPKQFEGRGTDYKDLLPLMLRSGAKVCYALNRHREVIYRINQSDYELFYSYTKSISMQTDIFCSFIENHNFEKVDYWTKASDWY